MSKAPLQETLNTLSQFVVSEISLEEALNQIADLTRKAIPPAEVVGYSLLDNRGNASTPVYTDERSPRIDQAQYDEKRGPCLDAGREKRVVYIPDVTVSEKDYPAFMKAAQAEGIYSTLSVPLVVADKGLGALNLYAKEPQGFSNDHQSEAVSLGGAVSVVLANVMAYWEYRSLSEHLGEAMKSRAVIEQAKGMLMAQNRGMGPEAAFDLLREVSRRENAKLRDIAQRIIDRSTDFDTGASGSATDSN